MISIRHKYLSIISILFVILTGCTQAPDNKKYNSNHMIVIPENITPKQKIKIEVNHSEKIVDSSYFRIMCYNKECLLDHFRIPIPSGSNKRSIFYTVPEQTVFLRVILEEKGKALLHQITGVINDSTDFIHGRIRDLEYSWSHEEIIDKFKHLDSISESKLSWGYKLYIENILLKILPTNKEVDSMYKYIKSYHFSNIESEFESNVALFLGFTLVKDYDKAYQMLKLLKSQKYAHITPSDIVKILITKFYSFNSIPSLETYEAVHINDETLKVFKELYTWKEIYTELASRTDASKRIDSVASQYDFIQDFIDYQSKLIIKNITDNGKEGFQVIYDVLRFYKYNNMYEEVKELINSTTPWAESLKNTDVWDREKIVRVEFDDFLGRYGLYLSILGEMASRAGNLKEAEYYWLKIINTQDETDIMYGSKFTATLGLAKLYTKTGKYDQAATAIAQLKKYDQDPSFEETYNVLVNKMNKLKIDTSKIVSIIHKEEVKDFEKHVAPSTIVYNGKSKIDLSSLNNKTAMLFLDPICPSCNGQISLILKLINDLKECSGMNIVLVTDKTYDSYDLDMYYIDYSKKLLKNFGDIETPSTVVIKNGYIVWEENYIPSTKSTWKHIGKI